MEEVACKKRVRVDSDELGIDSPEVKRLREDLLDDLDEFELCTAEQDLDSFMKSFEEEITASPPPASAAAVVDLTSESGESQPDLGYLLEASDDELGLPPATASPPAEEAEKPELIRVSSDSAELTGDLWGLDDHLASYDSYEFGIVDSDNYNINGGEYAALDGLFDHSDLAYGSGDYLWRPETLPAN
nr:Carbohydrate-responsive element-binding protein [Ipomoea batatas]